MYLRLLLLMLIGTIAGISCTGTKPAAQDRHRPALADAPDHVHPAAQHPAAPVPPRDAQWTIHCYTVTGPNHIAQARRLKQDLINATPLRDWYVVHQQQQSILYYGFYRAITDHDPRDAAEAIRAQSDHRQIRDLIDARGDRMFRDALFVGLDLPDPDGPPEWNLLNARGAWTLQIAAYKDHPDRKQYAVDAVREARAAGIEAYYYHGPTTSSVTIGAWPREAVRQQETDVAATRNPNQPIAVLTEDLPVSDLRDPDGRPVQVFRPVFEPVDPSLIAAMQRYPEHSVNGYQSGQRVRDPNTGRVRFVPDSSFIVELPQREPTLLSGPDTAAPQPARELPPSFVPRPPQQQQQTPPRGVGGLRSIE